VTIDRQQASTLEKLDDGVDTFNEPLEETTNTRTPRYENAGDALKGVATTVGGIASGAVGATLGLPTDIVGLFKGLKEAVSAEDGKRLDAFSEGFTEFSKENLGSQYYKDVFDTFVDSLDVDPVLKEDAKSGFSAGEFITPTLAGGSAVKAVTKIDKIKNNLARAETSATKIKDNTKRKIESIRSEFQNKAPQTYTKDEVLAMTAKRESSPVRKASDTEKAIPVMPVNQSSLEARGFDYQAGGRYINPITKEDLTGKNIGSANIKINTEKGIQGGKPQADFIVKNVGVSEVGSKGLNILTNLIKPSSKGKKAGWFFINKNKDIDENINTLVAVVQDNKHYYTLETDFSKGANLKTYPNQKHEPRLRPSVKGNLKFGNIVAKINMGKYPDKIKGKPHPMAGKDRIHNLYDKITAYKDGGLVKQKGLMARA